MVVARFLSIPKPGYPVKAADNLLFQHVRQKLKVTFLLGCFAMSHAMKKILYTMLHRNVQSISSIYRKYRYWIQNRYIGMTS